MRPCCSCSLPTLLQFLLTPYRNPPVTILSSTSHDHAISRADLGSIPQPERTMAGTLHRSGNIEVEPNLIPMIDVMLVLLIIFILLLFRLVTNIQVPAPDGTAIGAELPPIVLELAEGEGFRLNGQAVADRDLEATLQEVFAERPARHLFVTSAPDRRYQELIEAIGRAKGAGVQVVSMLP